MRDTDLSYFGPVRQPTPAETYDRLIDALNGLRAKLDTAPEARIGDLSQLLADMVALCYRAHGAAVLLEEKCKAEGRT